MKGKYRDIISKAFHQYVHNDNVSIYNNTCNESMNEYYLIFNRLGRIYQEISVDKIHEDKDVIISVITLFILSGAFMSGVLLLVSLLLLLC